MNTNKYNNLCDCPLFACGDEYVVFYAKNISFYYEMGFANFEDFVFDSLGKTESILADQYVRIGSFSGLSRYPGVGGTDMLNLVYEALQGENWSSNGEATTLIAACGSSHTSMSVGDGVFMRNSGAFYVCAPTGWVRL